MFVNHTRQSRGAGGGAQVELDNAVLTRRETMKAMVLRELGGPLRLEQVPMPRVGPGDAIVRVHATGIGLTVVIMTANPGLVTAFPRIPGHEIAGKVVEVGSEVKNVVVGDRVACHFYL